MEQFELNFISGIFSYVSGKSLRQLRIWSFKKTIILWISAITVTTLRPVFFTRTLKEWNFFLTFVMHQPHADAFKLAFLNQHYFYPLICVVFCSFGTFVFAWLLHSFFVSFVRTCAFTVIGNICELFHTNKISEQTC